MSFDKTLRRAAQALALPFVYAMKPVKVWAYTTKSELLRRLILEFTTFFDWAMVFACVQNETMQIHHRVWGGNFVFGKAVMVVDHAQTVREISRPVVRGNNFMGLDIVSTQSFVFATNSPVLNQSPPIRALTRKYIDETMFDERVLSLTADDVAAECAEILSDWEADEDMVTMWPIRSTVTRVFLKILAGVTITKEDAEDVTFAYSRRFAEASLLGRYLPFLMGVLGTKERVRRDAYFKLQAYGIDPLTIGLTLFAAMFSVGTIVIKCTELAREHDVDYRALSPRERFTFVLESLRLYPTVTTVHRIVERDEDVEIAGRVVGLRGGDEVAYPFVISNRDADVFEDPDALRLDRPREAYGQILSFSKGPHSCPAKDLGVTVAMLMLDAISERHDLRALDIFSPIF